MKNSFIEFMDLVNIDIAFEIVKHYDVYRLRYKYSCSWAAILDFWLPLASHNIVTSFVEFLALENMGLAVGISFLRIIGAEIRWG